MSSPFFKVKYYLDQKNTYTLQKISIIDNTWLHIGYLSIQCWVLILWTWMPVAVWFGIDTYKVWMNLMTTCHRTQWSIFSYKTSKMHILINACFFQTAEVNYWGQARGPLWLPPKRSYTTFLRIIHWWNHPMHCPINPKNIVFSTCSHISLIFKKYLFSSFASQI